MSRSEWHFTVPYPREYVEYLEEQQEQLSTGLLTMYRLLKESNIKTVPPLPDKPQAQDLLTALRGLKLDDRSQASSYHRPLPTHSHSHPGHFATPLSSSPNVVDTRFQSPTMHPQFESVPSTPQDINASASSRIPTSMPGSFVPGPFGSFVYARQAQPPVFQGHRHSLPTEYATAAGLGPPGGLADTAMSSSWHHSTNAWSPVTSLQMSSPATVMKSPQLLMEDIHVGDERESNNQMLRHHQQQHQSQHHHQQQHEQQPQAQQPQWAAGAWTGETESGVGMFTNFLTGAGGGVAGGGNNHDSGLGLEAESIEQHGEIVLPHDPRAL